MDILIYSLIAVILGLGVLVVILFTDREEAHNQIFNLRIVNRQQRIEIDELRRDRPPLFYGAAAPPPELTPAEQMLEDMALAGFDEAIDAKAKFFDQDAQT